MLKYFFFINIFLGRFNALKPSSNHDRMKSSNFFVYRIRCQKIFNKIIDAATRIPCMEWCTKTNFMKKINIIINRRVVWKWLYFRDVYLDSTYWQIALCTYISVHKYTIHVYKWIYYSWMYTHEYTIHVYRSDRILTAAGDNHRKNDNKTVSGQNWEKGRLPEMAISPHPGLQRSK